MVTTAKGQQTIFNNDLDPKFLTLLTEIVVVTTVSSKPHGLNIFLLSNRTHF